MTDIDPWGGSDTSRFHRLNFRSERDNDTTSWQRADPRAPTEIERIDRTRFAVELPDGNRHVTEVAKTPDGWVGRCSCRGFEFTTGPCAHLCTLRKGDYIGAVTVATTDDALTQECPRCGQALPPEAER